MIVKDTVLASLTRHHRSQLSQLLLRIHSSLDLQPDLHMSVVCFQCRPARLICHHNMTADKLALRADNGQLIVCPLKYSGCLVTGTPQQISAHIGDCLHYIVYCPDCSKLIHISRKLAHEQEVHKKPTQVP